MEVETMNDYQGVQWGYAMRSDAQVELYEKSTKLFCGMLLVIAALALFLGDPTKYVVVWVMLFCGYLCKRLTFDNHFI